MRRPKASLDLVTVFVDGVVMRDGDLAVVLGGDHRLGVDACDLVAQVVAVIGFVGEYRLGALAFEQSGCRCYAAGLSGRDAEPQGPTERVGLHVDLGGQPASGTPQRLVLGLPFPVAA